MNKIDSYKTSDGTKLALTFEDAEDVVDGITIKLKGMPLLTDRETGTLYKSPFTANVVSKLAAIAKRDGLTVVDGVTPPMTLSTQRFKDYCPNVNFDYSAIEYFSVPGLAHGMSNNGFLAPVYFSLDVLNKYAQNPRYTLSILSSTYGSIWCADEWHISFGVNASKQVVMWLGDIHSLPMKEQQYLLSENIPSAFDLHSDFYDAQIENKWSEGAIENKCLRLREEFSEKVTAKFGANMYRLPNEIGKTISDLQKPIYWEDRHVATVVESLNRIFVESIDEKFLKAFLVAAGIKLQDGLRALKLMEKFIEHLSKSALDARAIMLPFFVLYDYRINVCHLQSEETVATKIQSINERIGLDVSNVSHEKIYDQLFSELEKSFVRMNELVV